MHWTEIYICYIWFSQIALKSTILFLKSILSTCMSKMYLVECADGCQTNDVCEGVFCLAFGGKYFLTHSDWVPVFLQCLAQPWLSSSSSVLQKREVGARGCVSELLRAVRTPSYTLRLEDSPHTLRPSPAKLLWDLQYSFRHGPRRAPVIQWI